MDELLDYRVPPTESDVNLAHYGVRTELYECRARVCGGNYRYVPVTLTYVDDVLVRSDNGSVVNEYDLRTAEHLGTYYHDDLRLGEAVER